MTTTLTARFVDSVKPKKTRAEYFDAQVAGLSLRVTAAGKKSWTVMYRHRGRLRRLTLGSLDALTLAQARERARDELYAVSKGNDVASVKRDAKTADTITLLADEYIAKYARPRKKSWKADRQRLDRHVVSAWKHRAVVDIKARDVMQLVDRVAVDHGPIEANRLVSLCSKMFKYAMHHGIITASPAVGLPKPGREQSRDRVLSEPEIRGLWATWDALGTMGEYFKLRLLTAQRGQEVRDLRWQDLDADISWWTIPREAAKNGLAHRVPLCGEAARIIAARLAVADEKDVYVLAGARGRRQQYEATEHFAVEDFVPHDLRRTAASIMASGGVSRFVIGRVLNHIEASVTAVYDRHSYDAEKTAAFAWWNLKLTSILANKPSTVLPFAKTS